MALGRPAIQTPNQLEIRTIAGAISNARQRIEALEAAIQSLTDAGFAATAQNSVLLNLLRNQVAQLVAQMSTLTALLGQGNGLVTLVNGVLLTRTLTAGDNITIDFPDGAGGNPVISSTGGGGFAPLSTGEEPLVLVSDGEGQCVMVPYP